MKRLLGWFVALDRILKGEATRISDLRDASIAVPIRGLSFVLILLGMLYGVCMGCYALVNHDNGMQLLASTVKVPALFFLTLLVTLPSLYVFNALVGSRLTVGGLVRLFIATLGVNLAVLSSLGPIVAFFSVNTTTYAFMVLLNVIVFAIAGLLGLSFLVQTLQRLHICATARRRERSRSGATAQVSRRRLAKRCRAGNRSRRSSRRSRSNRQRTSDRSRLSKDASWGDGSKGCSRSG